MNVSTATACDLDPTWFGHSGFPEAADSVCVDPLQRLVAVSAWTVVLWQLRALFQTHTKLTYVFWQHMALRSCAWPRSGPRTVGSKYLGARA